MASMRTDQQHGFSGFGRLTGGTLADQFSFTDNGSLTGSITGAGGINTISFESRTGAVRLNMQSASPVVLDHVSSALIVPAFTQVARFTGFSLQC